MVAASVATPARRRSHERLRDKMIGTSASWFSLVSRTPLTRLSLRATALEAEREYVRLLPAGRDEPQRPAPRRVCVAHSAGALAVEVEDGVADVPSANPGDDRPLEAALAGGRRRRVGALRARRDDDA